MTNDTNSRLHNTTTCFPISYGSIAFYLGKDNIHNNPTATHRWTLYVRSPDPTYDLSQSISKVIFQLHPSFPQPTRELTQPPFEVTEMGWGEFEASIRIVWKEEAEERPVLLTHFIKLYPSNAPVATVDPSTYMNTTVPVVSEKYDEVVFTNPKVVFHKQLLDGQQQSRKNKKKKQLTYPLSHESSVMEHFRTYGDETDVKAMLAAKEFLQKELRSMVAAVAALSLLASNATAFQFPSPTSTAVTTSNRRDVIKDIVSKGAIGFGAIVASNSYNVEAANALVEGNVPPGKGDGDEVKEGKKVNMQWVLRRSNGYFVDSSAVSDSVPFIFTVGDPNGAIQGLDEGIRGMKAGGTRRILIPPRLAWMQGVDDGKPGPLPAGFGPRQQMRRVMKDRIDVPGEYIFLEVKVSKVR
ncbi:transcription initiation factor TFIID subunit 14 family protein [Skeletonema marinoi]|uniref:peptidylprolyl isomerase n=1 Tax=Skeletonema marinoi TaxID=267567 RepID=A0AAD8YI36_9STRA|nr:transcription initiation factor TFIID subunit 14 family protein [Skeletonema marinoi]